MPHILVISNRYPGAYKAYAGIYVKRHVQLHRAGGIKVTIIAPRTRFKGFLGKATSFFFYLVDLLWAALKNDFDIIHAHWPVHAGLFGALVSYVRKKPFVLTSHGAYVDDLNPRKHFVKSLSKFALRRADVVIVVGRQHQKLVEQFGDLPPERLRLIDMGVWHGEKEYERAEARKIVEISSTQKAIIFIGNLETRKGVDTLLRAFSLITDQLPDTYLYIGGQGPEVDPLRSMAEELNLGERVKFLGPIQPDDVFLWFSAADVCVVPSRREPFGLVALEAMVSGTIVLVSDVGGLRETVSEGQDGFFFPVEDFETLSELLVHVLTNDELRHSMAKSACNTARQYDMREKAAQVANVYRELLDSRSQEVG